MALRFVFDPNAEISKLKGVRPELQQCPTYMPHLISNAEIFIKGTKKEGLRQEPRWAVKEVLRMNVWVLFNLTLLTQRTPSVRRLVHRQNQQ